MLIELNGSSYGRVLAGKLEKGGLYLAPALPYCLYDGLGIYAFMDVQRYCRNLKRGVFGLPGPDELGVKVRIILISLGWTVYISSGCDQPNGWII